jgi:hypothetical protein
LSCLKLRTPPACAGETFVNAPNLLNFAFTAAL